MLPTVCFISFHELGLKGRNRSTFERRLQENLDAALASHRTREGESDQSPSTYPARRIAGRLTVALTGGADPETIAAVLAKVPGVTRVAIAYQTGRDLEEIRQVSLRALREAIAEWDRGDGAFCPTPPTFKVVSRRSSTDFPLPSMELSAQLGEYLIEHTHLPVRMKHPDITLKVTIVEGQCYISTKHLPGIGGLPSGSSGRVVSLLSAGFDSPVATWRLLKRGAIVLGLHFSGRPATGDSSERLVAEIAEVLAQTGGLARVYTVPFGDIQREIAGTVEPSLRVIMYRRLMFAIATRVAHTQRAKALVTGESLGQVASQTLDNIVATGQVTALPILRPLIGSDKQEIITEAQRIGTHDLSALDSDDCCTLFMPRRPETHAKLPLVQHWWSQLDTEALITQALQSGECREYTQRFGTSKPLLSKTS